MFRTRSAPIPNRTMTSIRRLHCFSIFLLFVLIAPQLIPTVRGAESAAQTKMESIQLPKLTVKGEAVCSFGFGVSFSRERETLKVKRVFISQVESGSAAEKRGLQVGDEIMAINGEKVAGMEGEIQRGKQFFDLLVDQEPGQTIDIEVVVRVTKKFTLSAAKPWLQN